MQQLPGIKCTFIITITQPTVRHTILCTDTLQVAHVVLGRETVPAKKWTLQIGLDRDYEAESARPYVTLFRSDPSCSGAR